MFLCSNTSALKVNDFSFPAKHGMAVLSFASLWQKHGGAPIMLVSIYKVSMFISRLNMFLFLLQSS